MYKMSKRSVAIRALIVPLFLPLWAIGMAILLLNLTFDKLWDVVDKLRDRLESWVNRVAPLD